MTREEAIDIIRKNIPHLGIGATEMTEALNELIPELRESDDERVIRTLYYLVNDHDWLNGATKGEVLTWLEKLKVMTENGYGTYYYYDGGFIFLASPVEEETYKESLHVAETCKENADSFTDEDERIRKELINFFQSPFIKDNLTDEKVAPWLTYLEKQKYDRMKPIYDAKESFESALEKAWNDYHNGYENVDKLEDDYVECAHAKGFREGYLFGIEKQKEQKPAEWSEEDERMFSRCVKSIESSKQFADSDTFKEAKDKEIDWLENRLKSLRPSWKPSEEQMNALNFAITHFVHYTNYKNLTELRELYDDLLKLK